MRKATAAILGALILAAAVTAVLGALDALGAEGRGVARGPHCGCPAGSQRCSTPCSICCAPGPCLGDPTCHHHDARR